MSFIIGSNYSTQKQLPGYTTPIPPVPCYCKSCKKLISLWDNIYCKNCNTPICRNCSEYCFCELRHNICKKCVKKVMMLTCPSCSINKICSISRTFMSNCKDCNTVICYYCKKYCLHGTYCQKCIQPHIGKCRCGRQAEACQRCSDCGLGNFCNNCLILCKTRGCYQVRCQSCYSAHFITRQGDIELDCEICPKAVKTKQRCPFCQDKVWKLVEVNVRCGGYAIDSVDDLYQHLRTFKMCGKCVELHPEKQKVFNCKSCGRIYCKSHRRKLRGNICKNCRNDVAEISQSFGKMEIIIPLTEGVIEMSQSLAKMEI